MNKWQKLSMRDKILYCAYHRLTLWSGEVRFTREYREVYGKRN